MLTFGEMAGVRCIRIRNRMYWFGLHHMGIFMILEELKII